LDRESQHLEYKSTLRTRADGSLFRLLESSTLTTIAAFANSYGGGALLVGVTDEGSVCGIGTDYGTLRKPGKDDQDLSSSISATSSLTLWAPQQQQTLTTTYTRLKARICAACTSARLHSL
jgi:predicted HTH transcriptional regulator